MRRAEVLSNEVSTAAAPMAILRSETKGLPFSGQGLLQVEHLVRPLREPFGWSDDDLQLCFRCHVFMKHWRCPASHGDKWKHAAIV